MNPIADGLRALGLKAGDHVLARASLRRLGGPRATRAEALIAAILDVVGPEGTLAALAFHPMVPFPGWRKLAPVDATTRPSSGWLAAALAARPDARRSAHPACGWAAVGAGAERLVAGHDAEAACFHPIAALLDMDGVLINVGNVADSPGFSTVHHVQAQLGLSTRNLLAGRMGLRTPDGIFVCRDFPGCSKGFGKFYGAYVAAGILRAGMVGDAYSILARARDLVAVERPLIEADPRYPLCDHPLCQHCRGLVTYNKRDWPGYWLRRVFRRGRRK